MLEPVFHMPRLILFFSTVKRFVTNLKGYVLQVSPVKQAWSLSFLT